MANEGVTMKDEIGVRLDGISDKLDNMRQEWKDDVGDLKKGQGTIWKELRKVNSRQTKTETRIERCGILSGGQRECPTTEKLKRLETSGEREKDRGLTRLGIFAALIGAGLATAANFLLQALSRI